MIELMNILEKRFLSQNHWHNSLSWDWVKSRITNHKPYMEALRWMEESGGEPNVWIYEGKIGFVDTVKESPKGRRSLCYDEAGLQSRKDFPPQGDAIGLAQHYGVSLLNEVEYAYLQQFGPIDTKTSSWILTPTSVRELGGALFGEYRYGRVFTFHNGAGSYYAARGFRVCLWLND